MDKQTLSNYGWLVIVTLILAVMLAFATPFGTYVGDGVVSIANGYVQSSNNATDKDNISKLEQQWTDKLGTPNNTGEGSGNIDPTVHNGKVPEGGIYITGLEYDENGTSTCCGTSDYVDSYWCWCNANVYEEGDNFPSTVKQYDTYIYGDYIYMYQSLNAYYFGGGCPYTITIDDIYIVGFYDYTGGGSTSEKWVVGLNTTISDINTKTSYGEILSSINNQPVTSIANLFSNSNMNPTVQIATAPKVPQSVTNANSAFDNCPTLTGIIELPCHITKNSYYDCGATVVKYHYDGCGH